jgi:membrane protein DedA with SNARE-associated domain
MLADALGHLSASAAYTMVALAVLAESILLVGAFVPTLTLLLTAGVLARAGHLSLPVTITAAACAAVAGDFSAYRTGRFLGVRLRAGRLGRRVSSAAWLRVETLMNRHSGRAVFMARFIPVARTLTPHFAGATRIPYRRILPYSVAAACCWAAAEVGAGYAAATPLQRGLNLGGPAIVVAASIVAGIAILWRKRCRPCPR